MLAQKHQWSTAFFHASPIIVLVSGLFYYWFALVDRFIIFLYGHLGATAFNSITNGRYWMAGLVAGGIVMVLYTATNAVIGMMKAEYAPPTMVAGLADCGHPTDSDHSRYCPQLKSTHFAHKSGCIGNGRYPISPRLSSTSRHNRLSIYPSTWLAAVGRYWHHAEFTIASCH